MCCCCIRDNDINRRESRFFKKFVNSMVKAYDQNEEKHELALKRLYLEAFRVSEVPSDENM